MDLFVRLASRECMAMLMLISGRKMSFALCYFGVSFTILNGFLLGSTPAAKLIGKTAIFHDQPTAVSKVWCVVQIGRDRWRG